MGEQADYQINRMQDGNSHCGTLRRSSTMQVTGQILAVSPRYDQNNVQMQWQAHGKTFYTFDMLVQGPNGQVSGEISSTSANVYPKSAGEQITVDSYEQNGYPKLRAIQQDQQQGGQQQAPQQQVNQGNYQPPSQAPQRDYDKENRGKCRFGLYAQLLGSGVKPLDLANDRAALMAVETLIEYSMTGIPKADYPQPNQPFQQPAQQQAPPQQQQNQAPQQQFDSNAGFVPTDEIPF